MKEIARRIGTHFPGRNYYASTINLDWAGSTNSRRESLTAATLERMPGGSFSMPRSAVAQNQSRSRQLGPAPNFHNNGNGQFVNAFHLLLH